MSAGLPDFPTRRAGSFQQIVSAFLIGKGLAFASVLTAERIERVFAKHGGLFGFSGVYSTAMILWAFLGQVLRDGKDASCQAAVARISSYCLGRGIQPPTADTGDFCRARAKLPESALRELSREVGGELEQQAEHGWLWKGRHAKLIDGFTFTMPDTLKNQKQYPQNPVQPPGIGFPIARAVTVVSLATTCVLDATLGKYSGKQTGETALFRSLLPSLGRDDVAVMDRYYCSYLMIALIRQRGTHVCARKYHTRHTDFRRGRRLGKGDHLIHWARPPRPEWMDEATYASMPEWLELREVRFNVTRPGRRTKTLTIITTLTDAREFSADDVADLYGFRWNVELDIRSIKESLNLNHVRCKSPEMVRREFWTTLLAYNLIRSVAASAAAMHRKQPRQISFTGTCQYVLSSMMMLAGDVVPRNRLRHFCGELLSRIADCEVGNRPGRLEPRVLKRRLSGYPLMKKPRHVLKVELRKHCT